MEANAGFTRERGVLKIVVKGPRGAAMKASPF